MRKVYKLCKRAREGPRKERLIRYVFFSLPCLVLHRLNSPKQALPGTENGATEADDGEYSEISLIG